MTPKGIHHFRSPGDDPRLRPAEQLVAGEADEIPSCSDARSSGRLVTEFVTALTSAALRSSSADALPDAHSNPALAESAAVSTPLRAVSATLSMPADAVWAARSR